jgi:hypothetical protein
MKYTYEDFMAALSSLKGSAIYLLCIFLLSSCSPKPKPLTLPNYSDMGAAADAGKVQP